MTLSGQKRPLSTITNTPELTLWQNLRTVTVIVTILAIYYRFHFCDFVNLESFCTGISQNF